MAVADGVAWLKANQNPSGSWGDPAGSEFRDTTVVVEVLHSLGEAGSEYDAALSFLTYTSAANNDYLARQITAMARVSMDVTSRASDLLASQNESWSGTGIPNEPEGGWGIAPGYATDVLDTALALEALHAAGLAGEQLTAVNYLITAQNSDGGWGLSVGAGESNVYLTAKVLLTLNDYAAYFVLQTPINNGAQWLVAQQNPDGGWGSASSTVYETALAYHALDELDVEPNDPDAAVNYLLNSQAPDGSWNGAAYDTARAVLALARAACQPSEYKIYLPLIMRNASAR